MSSYTDEQWEAIASDWRKAASQTESVRLNAPEFVRWLKRDGYIKDYICVPDRDLPNAEGQLISVASRGFLPSSKWLMALRMRRM